MIKKINKIIVIFITLTLWFSCNNNQVVKEYSNEGYLKKEIYYSNNKIKRVVDYYPNGVVHSCSEFSDYDKGNCRITLYSIEGKVMGLMNYLNGLKHGEFIWYDTNGEVLIKEIYYNGVLVN